MSTLLAGLDPEQVEAVTTQAAPLAIIAAAGSGKTTVLTRRIAHRIAVGTALPQHVLALTFTRDAAGELRRRLRRLDIRETVEAGTFHAVALRLLRDRALARNATAPQLAGDRLRLARECVNQLHLPTDAHAALADIDWARARQITPDRYEGACRIERRRSGVPAERFGELAEAYERLKQRRGVVDFDDLLHQVLQALRSDPQWAEGIRWRYRHFFVDEAQDLNPLQHAVLEGMRGGRPDLCLVGDPRQAIYGWNGADPSMLAEVERRYPGVTVVRLLSNYRCSPQIVRAGAAVLVAAGQTDDAQSRQPSSAAVTVQQYPDEAAEADSVARRLHDLMLHRSGSDFAVLARTNEQLTALQKALTAHGIACERTAGRSPLDQVLSSAYHCTNRDQLAALVDNLFLGGDEIALRVAQEADRFLTSGEPGTFRSWIEARTPFDDLEPDDRRDAVSLLTFHAAKGREWWGVFVCGAEDGLVPHGSASSTAQLAEEARLFYVAITRAAHHLVVTHAARRNARPAAPSRWLAAVSGSGEADEVVTPPARTARPVDPLVPYRAWRAAVARASGQPEIGVCTDRVLHSLLAEPPATTAELAARLGITETAAARLRPLPA
ncbi:MAG: ATP-dependent helicase [Actinomycetota bacterium]